MSLGKVLLFGVLDGPAEVGLAERGGRGLLPLCTNPALCGSHQIRATTFAALI